MLSADEDLTQKMFGIETKMATITPIMLKDVKTKLERLEDIIRSVDSNSGRNLPRKKANANVVQPDGSTTAQPSVAG